MNEHGAKDVARQMFESAQLSGAELESALARARDPDYWRHRDPSLGLGTRDCRSLDETRPLDADEIAKLTAKLTAHGYFYAEPMLPVSLMQGMRAGVERLRLEHWPPVFAFIYDEFWSVVRTASLRRLLSECLGPGYRQDSHMWTYYVAPRGGATGWPPHIDAGGEQRLTVWIPLTDATVENGCIYVIPRNLVPSSLPADSRVWKTVNRLELDRLLQSTRALPAAAGSIAGWDHHLFHWGSTSHGSTTPRVSIAVEFVGAGISPTRSERPLLDPASMPTFTQRLYVIGKAILEYRKFEPSMARYSGFAKRLVAHCAEEGSR